MGMMRWLCRCLHAAPPKHEGACMKKCENWAIEELAPALCYFWWRSFVFLQSCNTNWGNAESVFPLWDDFTTLHLKTEHIFLNTNRKELLQMLTINYNLTYESVVKRPIGPKKAMPALKSSTFTALASKRARAGSHSVWQRKRLPNIKNRQQETREAHLPENTAHDGNWCKLLMSDTAHGLHMQCAGYQRSQRAASHMVKGKNHYKPTLSLPCYLRHEHVLPAVQDRGTSTTRGPTPGSQHQLPRPCQDSDPEESQAFGRGGYSTSVSCPKRHKLLSTWWEQPSPSSSCNRTFPAAAGRKEEPRIPQRRSKPKHQLMGRKAVKEMWNDLRKYRKKGSRHKHPICFFPMNIRYHHADGRGHLSYSF